MNVNGGSKSLIYVNILPQKIDVKLKARMIRANVQTLSLNVSIQLLFKL